MGELTEEQKRTKILLFMGVKPNDPQYAKLQMDFQSSYSITFHTISTEMCKYIKKFMPNPQVIVDGTASVGLGDVRMFKQHFPNAKVYGVEMDPRRYRMFQHNKQVLGLDVVARNGSVLNVVPKILDIRDRTSTVIFVDPPWGGENYKDTKLARVNLSNRHFALDCATLFKYAALVALKLPMNFDLQDFRSRLPRKIAIYNIKNPNIRKQMFLILQAHPNK